jgi:hypothetical protein
MGWNAEHSKENHMHYKKLALIVVTNCLLASALWAGADKACLKKAKADYNTELKSCKDLKGAEKKSCTKEAKASYKRAKSACS